MAEWSLSSDRADLTVTGTAASPSPVKPRRRLAVSLLAGAVSLALMLGVGAYIAYQKLFGDQRHPEEFTPSSVVAFVGVELDASIDQRLKLSQLLKKINRPGSGTELTAENVLSELLNGVHLTGVDVKRDLTSWLGNRLALSVWFDDRSRFYALFTATSKDDSKATAGLERLRSTVHDADLGFVVRDNRALIAIGERDAQQAADAAAAAAEKSPLSQLASFRDARRWLDQEQIIMVWLDQERLNTAIQTAAGPELGAIVSPTGSAAPHGTSVVGVRATDNGVEARFRTFGAQAKAGPIHDATARLSGLPADTQVGAIIGLPDELAGGPSLFGSGLGLNGVLYALFGGIALRGEVPIADPPVYPSAAPPNLTAEEVKELDALLNKKPEELTAEEATRLKELMSRGFDFPPVVSPSSSPGVPPVPPEDFPAPGDIPDPLAALAGATVVVAVTQLATDPSVKAVITAASNQAATDLAKLTEHPPADLRVEVQGNTIVITTANYVAGSGRLGDAALFQTIMAGAPTDASTAIYFDLQAALKEEQRARVPVRAIGMVEGMDGSDQVGLLRIVLT